MENIRVGQQLRLPLRFTVVDTIPQQLHSTLRGQVTGRRALTGDRNGPPRWRALPLTDDWPTERIPPVPVAGEVSVTGVLEHGDGLGTPGKDVVVDQFFLRHSGPWHYADQTELRAHPGRRDAYQHPPGPRRFPPAQWVADDEYLWLGDRVLPVARCFSLATGNCAGHVLVPTAPRPESVSMHLIHRRFADNLYLRRRHAAAQGGDPAGGGQVRSE